MSSADTEFLEARLLPVSVAFEQNVDRVDRLLDFDKVVLEFAIELLDRLVDRLAEAKQRVAATSVKNARDTLKNVQGHDSLRAAYETVFGQGVVLLVSYFASALGDVFRVATAYCVERGVRVSLLSQDIKLPVGSISDLQGDPGAIGDLVVAQKNISFQDMQSACRAFRELFGCSLDRGEMVNDIIAAQACRHCLVHAGGVVNFRTVKQLSDARPRRMKPSLSVGDRVTFSRGEVREVATAMKLFLGDLSANLVRSIESRI